MDDNFSPKVKDVIAYSKEEALRLGHDFIGTEHLMLGILRKGKGEAYISGEYTDAKLKDKVSLELDKSGGSLVGTVNRKICAKGLGCEKTETGVSVDVPDGMTGNSILLIDIESNEKGKKLEGDATLTLSNGDTYNLDAKRKYNSKKDETKYSLKGADEGSKAIKIKLTINDKTGDCTFFSGKALGQQLKYKLE